MPTSIFTDDTGRRRVRARWAVRVISATLVIGVTAVVLSLVTHVSLPSLGLPDPTSGNSDTAAQKPKPSKDPAPSTTTTNPAPVAPTTSAARRVSASGTTGQPTTTPSAPTTSNGKASDAPRAVPTHTPGTPPTAPPGKSK